MHYVINDELLRHLKKLAANSPENSDIEASLTAAEANPLIDTLYWTYNDLLAECRKLVKPETSEVRTSRFARYYAPFIDSRREMLAREIAGSPDDVRLGVRDEIDTELNLYAVGRWRDVLEESLGEIGVDVAEILPDGWTYCAALHKVSDEAIAGGLMACALEIASDR